MIIIKGTSRKSYMDYSSFVKHGSILMNYIKKKLKNKTFKVFYSSYLINIIETIKFYFLVYRGIIEHYIICFMFIESIIKIESRNLEFKKLI
jgi:hypothetical protein